MENVILTIIGIAVLGFFAFLMIGGLVVDPIIQHYKIKKRNKAFFENDNIHKRVKMRCLDCKYCQTFKDHAFYKYGPLGNVAVTKHPKYCRRFKVPLKSDANLRCITPLAEQAMWESKE